MRLSATVLPLLVWDCSDVHVPVLLPFFAFLSLLCLSLAEPCSWHQLAQPNACNALGHNKAYGSNDGSVSYKMPTLSDGFICTIWEAAET